MENIYLPKIDTLTEELKNTRDNNILFKYTCKGTKFMKFEKTKFLYPTKLDLIQIENTFNSFTYPMYETLLNGLPTKIYLDLDFKNITCSIYNGKEKIIKDFMEKFEIFLKNKNIVYENIIYMDASRTVKKNEDMIYKISYHVVVNGIGFKDRNILKELILEFKNGIDDDFLGNAIDDSVYKCNQLFKCVYSPAKDSLNKLKPLDEKLNKINLEHINIIDCLSGIYVDNYKYLDKNFNYLLEKNKKVEPKKINKNIQENIPEKTLKFILNNDLICGNYRPKNNFLINNKINLIRLKPAYCKICKRIHHNENAYINVSENNMFFHCGRNNQSGKRIGKFRLKYETSNYILENTIKKLKKYIVELEETIEILKKDISINIVKKEKKSKEIKIKKYSKNIEEGMWSKYFNLGKFITLDYKEKISDLLHHWDDKNYSRLKNRSLRIYNYISKFGFNKFNFTIKYIFNLKNEDYEKIINK